MAETEAFIAAKHKSFSKKYIKMLETHWIDCISVEGKYLDE